MSQFDMSGLCHKYVELIIIHAFLCRVGLEIERGRRVSDVSNISLPGGGSSGRSRFAAVVDGGGKGNNRRPLGFPGVEGAISMLLGFADPKLEVEFSVYLNSHVSVSQNSRGPKL